MASEADRPPLGLPPDSPRVPAPEEEAPAERRERGMRALSVASRLLAAGSVFFFLAFLFAYFYLRSLNVEGLWHPHHVKPDKTLGVIFIVLVLASAGLAIMAGRREQGGWEKPWTGLAWGAVALGLIAVGVQCYEYTVQDFGPTDGGFASVFCAWTAFYIIWVIFAMYWLEICTATETRERRSPTGKLGEGTHVYEDPDRLLPRGMDAAVFFWSFTAGIGVITFVVLYLL